MSAAAARSNKRLLLLWGEKSQGRVVWAHGGEPAVRAEPEGRKQSAGGFVSGSEAKSPDKLLCVAAEWCAGHLMLRTPERTGEAEGGTTPSVETVGLKGETRSNHGPPHPARCRGDREGARASQGEVMAPSGSEPVSENLQSSMSRRRARATIPIFLMRSPWEAKRRWYQRVRAESG